MTMRHLKSLLVAGLLPLLFALSGCEQEADWRSDELVGFSKETNWRDTCARASAAGWGQQAGQDLDAIDQEAGIYIAAWDQCRAQYSEAEGCTIWTCLELRDGHCGTSPEFDDETNRRHKHGYYYALVSQARDNFCSVYLRGQEE